MVIIVTLKDIAKEANVSVMTVSNVIHKRKAKVSEKTEKKILEIIKKYNYTPNMSARSLVNNSSKLIAFILYQNRKDERNLFENPFNTEVLAGVDEVLKENDYYLLVQSVSTLEEIYLIIKTWRAAGVIILGILPNEVSHLKGNIDTPVVLIDTIIPNEAGSIYTVGIDDRDGFRIATEHLIANGHRDIGFVSYSRILGGVDEQRYLGYVDVLEAHGIEIIDDRIFRYNKDEMNMDEFCNEIAKKKNLITGLVFTADFLAIEVMNSLRSKGITIPDEISVVGFDNLSISKFVTPKLTTVHQDITTKGKEAANILLEVFKENESDRSGIKLPVQLVERESVKNIEFEK
ncbi:LacI family DNA-binding transcriptional regulator [Ferdinandcohnia quinoae]|uniref:LacI family transcriptional regulator n=1 Tax=Fredinandcohnia quinoae TaxID=2918902 RepID=A0AAW5DYT5_9BACI|nr:LacI family DNA-binding transcriptional regulator [Fredinandcohnia sp. SECRCQ15]MCH1624170.1 LacI family transcriptional regulator [Fredinandcohnia sp. SECRCQ15]